MMIERIGKGSTYRVAHELLGNYYRVKGNVLIDASIQEERDE